MHPDTTHNLTNATYQDTIQNSTKVNNVGINPDLFQGSDAHTFMLPTLPIHPGKILDEFFLECQLRNPDRIKRNYGCLES